MGKPRPSLFLLIALTACGPTQQPPPQKQPENDHARHRQEIWERRRQCAGAIDDVVRRAGWTKEQTVSVSATVSHYNEAEERCYVRIDVINREWSKARKEIPLMYYVIVDAFDNGETVLCTDRMDVNAGFCTISETGKDDVFDCARCQARAREMMTR